MDNPEVQIPPAENIDVEMEETREPVEQQKDGTGEPVEQQQDAESTQDATVVTTQDDSVAVQEKNEGLKFIEYDYPFFSSVKLLRTLSGTGILRWIQGRGLANNFHCNCASVT